MWEQAKRLGIFSDAQRARLKDTQNELHLERLSDRSWALQNFDKFRFEHRPKSLWPGEPVFSRWAFENKSGEQPLHLHLKLAGDDAVAENIALDIDHFFKLQISVSLQKGQSLVWDGSRFVKLYDDKGRCIKAVEVDRSLPVLKPGQHTIDISVEKMEGQEPAIIGVVKLRGEMEVIKSGD